MKITEITPELIDEMFLKHPKRGLLKETSQKIQYEFHIDLQGWFKIEKDSLIAENFYEENSYFQLHKTKNGIVYFFLTENALCFLEPFGKVFTGKRTCKKFVVNLEFTNGIPSKNNYVGFLLEKGVEFYVRKFVIPFQNGEMRIGEWKSYYDVLKK